MISSTHLLNALEAIEKDKSMILGMAFGSKEVSPGQQIPKAEAQSPPSLSYHATTGTYMVICLDLDAPFKSFNVLGPILHWIQPGLRPETVVDAQAKLVSGDTPFVANYIGPAPPPGSGPHRYVFLLYEQPADFDIASYAPAGGAKLSNFKRMRYDLEAFERQSKLGNIIACNYFSSN